MTVIGNRAIRNTFIFHAGQGNTIGLANLAHIKNREGKFVISEETRNAIFSQIQGFLPYPKTPINRNIFKGCIAALLETSEVLPQRSSIFKVDAVLPHIFSFLDFKQIARTAGTSLAFHEKSAHALTYLLNSKTSYTYGELVECQKAYHVDSVVEFLELFPEKTSSIAKLDLSLAPIMDIDLGQLLSFVPCLTSINLSFISYQSVLGDLSIETLAEKCPMLTDITLSGRNGLTDASLELLADKFPHLSSIDLSFCPGLTDNSIMPFAQKCTQLTELNLGGCIQLTEATVCTIIQKNPGLKRVYFAGCFNMSSLVISSLAQHCPQLESINPGLADPCIRMLARACPKVRFTYATDETLFLEQKKLDRYRRELTYKPVSVLGQLYCALLKENISDNFKNLKDDKFLNRIYFHMWELAGRPDEADWGRTHAFDEDKRDIFIAALETGIKDHFNRLTPEDKNCVYEKVYDISPDRDETDRRWGEKHALENLARLADAIYLIH